MGYVQSDVINRKKNKKQFIIVLSLSSFTCFFLHSKNDKYKTNLIVLSYFTRLSRGFKSRHLGLCFKLCKQNWIDNLTLNGRFERTLINEGQKC